MIAGLVTALYGLLVVAVVAVVVGLVVVGVRLAHEEGACHDRDGVLYDGQCVRVEVIR